MEYAQKAKAAFVAVFCWVYLHLTSGYNGFAQQVHNYERQFRQSRKAMISANSIIMLSIGLFIAAAILPTAITTFANTSLWTDTPAAVQTLATTVVPIVAVAVLVIAMVRNKRGS